MLGEEREKEKELLNYSERKYLLACMFSNRKLQFFVKQEAVHLLIKKEVVRSWE